MLLHTDTASARSTNNANPNQNQSSFFKSSTHSTEFREQTRGDYSSRGHALLKSHITAKRNANQKNKTTSNNNNVKNSAIKSRWESEQRRHQYKPRRGLRWLNGLNVPSVPMVRLEKTCISCWRALCVIYIVFHCIKSLFCLYDEVVILFTVDCTTC